MMGAAAAFPVQAVAGFEGSGYGWLNGRIVYAGPHTRTQHPRSLSAPWQPAVGRTKPPARATRAGAAHLLLLLRTGHLGQPQGFLRWACGQGLAFPMQAAAARLVALQSAIAEQHLPNFEMAAHALLGVGCGLTPSGDDVLAGIGLAFHQAPIAAWRARWPGAAQRLNEAAAHRTNPISAALLADMLAGHGYKVAHDLLDVMGRRFHRPDQRDQRAEALLGATAPLLGIGASSGSDLLTGLLLALCPSQLNT